MNHSAEFSHSSGTYSATSFRTGVSIAPLPFVRNISASSLPFKFFFCLCAGLVAAHLLVVSFAPRVADALIYGLWAMSIFTYAGVVLLQVRFASGMLALRWGLFALSLLCYGVDDVRASIGEFCNVQNPLLDSALLAIAATLVLLAITLPSGERIARVNLLDATVAIVFCAFRFLHLVTLSSPVVPISAVLAHYTFDPLIRVILALIALSASPWTKKKLYRNITFYLAADVFAVFCTNQIGYLWLRQHTASPWTLPGTLVPLAGGVFLLGSLTRDQSQSCIQVTESRKPLLRTLLPFAMTLLIVILCAELVSTHLYLAKLGMAFAATAFFVRVALLARHQDLMERSLRNALRNQNWQNGPDPLDKVEVEASFRPALWLARTEVSRDRPLSIILFKVEEAVDSLVLVETDLETENLIHIARHLSQWRPIHSSVYYLGNSIFAMLLPSTTRRSSLQLAEQIRTSIEALGLMGENGFLQLSVGAATAITAAEADRLFSNATSNLPQSQGRQRRFRLLRFNENARAR